MIDCTPVYAQVDSPIDALIWQHIADSPCPDDFRAYLRHAPEGAAHVEEAIARLIALDDADAQCSVDDTFYPAAFVQIHARAQAGDAVAQFHVGKMSNLGIACTPHADSAEGWYRAAILQGEPRSHINLAQLREEQGTPESLAEARRLHEAAAALGEPTALFNLGRMTLRGLGEPDQQANPLRAFELFHQAWDQGLALAGHWIAHMLRTGDGVRRDEEFARQWMQKSARAGCVGAILQLGIAAEFGDGVPESIPVAADWYRTGAELGDTDCQRRLATLQLRGEGIAKDGAQAVSWLKRAAVRNDPVAQRILGLTYLWGLNVVRNERFGRKWLQRSADHGDMAAAFHLGRLFQKQDPPDHQAALPLLEKAALKGHCEAQCQLGIAYWYGQGVAVDAHAAFKWIKLAALQGDPWGIYLLGCLHHAGIDVPSDFVKAAQYYRQAAALGQPSAQAKLGMSYLKGEGVDRDVAEGMLWLSRAAEQGDAEASVTIGIVLRDGIGVERNTGEASKWFLDAAEKGEARGQFELAMLYAEGNGLTRDVDEARKWMEKAAAQDEEGAAEWLTEHAQQGLHLV